MHVLVVEDNEINRLVALQIVKRMGLDARGVGSGPEAIEILSREQFDLILMDVQMSGMDGLETSRRIRSGAGGVKDPQVPIVAMTAFAGREDEQACYDAGMDGYVSKPINIDRLTETVRSQLGR